MASFQAEVWPASRKAQEVALQNTNNDDCQKTGFDCLEQIGKSLGLTKVG